MHIQTLVSTELDNFYTINYIFHDVFWSIGEKRFYWVFRVILSVFTTYEMIHPYMSDAHDCSNRIYASLIHVPSYLWLYMFLLSCLRLCRLVNVSSMYSCLTGQLVTHRTAFSERLGVAVMRCEILEACSRCFVHCSELYPSEECWWLSTCIIQDVQIVSECLWCVLFRGRIFVPLFCAL